MRDDFKMASVAVPSSSGPSLVPPVDEGVVMEDSSDEEGLIKDDEEDEGDGKGLGEVNGLGSEGVTDHK